MFVAGSAVYGADDPAEAVRELREQAEAATAAAGWGLRALTRRGGGPAVRAAGAPVAGPCRRCPWRHRAFTGSGRSWSPLPPGF